MNIVYISSYVPRKCGIATYTRDLSEEILNQGQKIAVLAMENDVSPPVRLKTPVISKIKQDSLGEHKKAARKINAGNFDLVHLQHEFGLFGGRDGRYILEFAKLLSIPLVVTFHTILLSPSKSQKFIVQELSRISSKVTVMEEIAKDRLETVYGIDPKKVTVIFHGVPKIDKINKMEAKRQLAVESKFVLLASNLISRNKGLEYVIAALPRIIPKIPNLIFLIVGETHPLVKKVEGESYRNELMALVKKYELGMNVKFVNKYLSLTELKTYLAAADVCITAYLDPQQITSGTLAYAIGVGKTCISTPYVYARKVLAKGGGVLVPFADSLAISNVLLDIYKNPKKMRAMEKRARLKAKEMLWPWVAKKHIKLYEETMTWENENQRTVSGPLISKDVNIAYLEFLTDDIGILQHAFYSLHERKFGYSTDDNARALVVVTALYGKKKSQKLLKLMKTYLSYLKYAQDESGKFHTFLNFQRQWVDKVDITDPFGKAMMAMGFFLSAIGDQSVTKPVFQMFNLSTRNLENIRDLRTAAYSILGLYYFISTYEGKKESAEAATVHLRKLADLMVKRFEQTSDIKWRWFEDNMTYDNFRLPQAMFAAYLITNDDIYKKVGEESLEFAKDCNFDRSKKIFDFVGQNKWYPRGGKKALYDQQPLEAAAAVEAYVFAYYALKKEEYLKLAVVANDWFFGRNRNRALLLDESTGGIFDGLTKTGVNQNEGAESLVCFLQAQISLQKLLSSKLFQKRSNT